MTRRDSGFRSETRRVNRLVALPLAMAFSIASGLTPQAGIYCAIVTGFLISALGVAIGQYWLVVLGYGWTGKGIAEHSSMIAAIKLAAELSMRAGESGRAMEAA